MSVSPLNEEYRERLLQMLTEYPELSRTDLRNECPKEYSFLYRHDREWLFEMLPTGKPQTGSKGYVDWNQRDHEVLSQLQKAQMDLLNREKPIRISKTSLGKEIANLSLLEKHLHKLPCCTEYIDKVSEKKQQFQLRRCQITIVRMQEEGLLLLEWRIQREAGIRKDDYKLIMDKLDYGNNLA
ncbi:Tn7-like transposition protein D (fragment) [Candidatus Desulfosporosinus infrequens]|uniref:Tn7-like transposition protein D n=1 Tax=Candidatus Desulfosporosinus infrequens TaxID=2043169 RepID=A0A2U3L1R9_9FIRM